jgi:hypothetical protein
MPLLSAGPPPERTFASCNARSERFLDSDPAIYVANGYGSTARVAEGWTAALHPLWHRGC